MSKSTHAILLRSTDDHKLYLVWQYNTQFVEFAVEDEPLSLLDLAKFCDPQHGLTHLWVHASTGMNACKGDVLELENKGYDILPQYDALDNLISIHGYKKLPRGRGPRFNIIFIEHTTWDWKDLTPMEVGTLILDLQRELGVTISGSPSGVGIRYLQKCCEKRPMWLDKPDMDLSKLPWEHAARPLIWQRQPLPEEIEQKYLYAYDKNAAYPRAAKEEKFGYGTPMHEGECAFNPDIPGMWRIDILHSPDLDTRLPMPVWNGFDWLATPIVKLLIKMGHEIEVREAWIFERRAHIFRQWVDSLWEFRREREGYEREAYKSIMNDTLGLTRSSKLGTNSFKYRPDWNMQVVAGARAVMHYNIMKYAEKGHYPIMCQMDALYYTSDQELPNLAIEGILDHCHSLGGYKLKFRIPMDEVKNDMTVRAILSSLMPQSKKLQLLNRIAEMYGY